jgi:hypothetical protein
VVRRCVRRVLQLRTPAPRSRRHRRQYSLTHRSLWTAGEISPRDLVKFVLANFELSHHYRGQSWRRHDTRLGGGATCALWIARVAEGSCGQSGDARRRDRQVPGSSPWPPTQPWRLVVPVRAPRHPHCQRARCRNTTWRPVRETSVRGPRIGARWLRRACNATLLPWPTCRPGR